jgi:protein TonB
MAQTMPHAGRYPGQQHEAPPDPDALFASLTRPQKKGRFWLGVHASVAAHVAIVAALILVPLFWPQPLPDQQDVIRLLIYNPPPPPPPPLPLGAAVTREMKPAQPVTPQIEPEKPAFTAPQDVIAAQNPKEERAPDFSQEGVADGSDMGMPEGMEGGVEGGVVGGVLGGVVGGVIGGTGDSPILDYDRPPRLIRQTKPQYPQEAFVKKIEGVVLVEMLIDASGRVAGARVLKSVPLLDGAALQTVRQWVFTPAMKRGRPVATIAHAPVAFRIY